MALSGTSSPQALPTNWASSPVCPTNQVRYSALDELEPENKEQLHEVADLLLDIYLILVRMRYLEEDWIEVGPHDISGSMENYRSYGLTDSIIYLYSILPYLTFEGEYRDFYGGGYFACFLDGVDDEDRDPLFTSDVLAPWMTTLSSMSNGYDCLVYCAKTHTLGIYNAGRDGSADPVYIDLLRRHPEMRRETSDDWAEVVGRPAGDVLRDIARWYHELVQVPGDGENGGIDWVRQVTEPLYRKHGWPGEDFDGDAFEVDHVRSVAANMAAYAAEEPLRVLEKEESWARNPPRFEGLEENIAAATTVDEEWYARWWLFLKRLQYEPEERVKSVKKAKERADRLNPNGQTQKTEHLPLWELEMIKSQMSTMQSGLTSQQHEKPDSPAAERAYRLKTRQEQKEWHIHNKAYEAAKKDADRLCPGMTFQEATGLKSLNSLDEDDDDGAEDARRAERADNVEVVKRWVEEIRGWVARLPDGAVRARAEAEFEIEKLKAAIQTLTALVK